MSKADCNARGNWAYPELALVGESVVEASRKWVGEVFQGGLINFIPYFGIFLAIF